MTELIAPAAGMRALLVSLLLCACDPQALPTPPDLPDLRPVCDGGSWHSDGDGAIMCGPHPALCTGWSCRNDNDCPPTLCAWADRFGRCISGTCTWRM